MHPTAPSKISDSVVAANTRSALSSEMLNSRQRPFHGASVTRASARISVTYSE